MTQKKYTVIEEEENSSAFIEILLCIIFLPIGIIVGIVKLINALSNQSEQKQVQKKIQTSVLEENKHQQIEYNTGRLKELTELRNKGVLSEEEFQDLRSDVMSKLMKDTNKRKQMEENREHLQKVQHVKRIIGITLAIIIFVILPLIGLFDVLFS